MTDLDVFRSFYNFDDAKNLQQFLEGKGIHCVVNERKVYFDTVYAGHSDDKNFFLLMKGYDFKRADSIIDEEIEANLADIDPDYYLYSFSNEELQDVLAKPDEWNNQDVLISRKLLAERGIAIDDHRLHQMKITRIKELAKPADLDWTALIVCYVFSIFFGIFGAAGALIIIGGKKVLPDGTRISTYSARTRDHAWTILAVGLSTTLLVVIRAIFS